MLLWFNNFCYSYHLIYKLQVNIGSKMKKKCTLASSSIINLDKMLTDQASNHRDDPRLVL